MRLSDWREAAPRKESMSQKVLATIDAALDLLGADPDPDCWVAWGDDPNVRYTILIATLPGLLSINVRVNVPGEGPRAAGKLVRWNRVQIGEFAIEIQAGHRLVNFQIDNIVLRGKDEEADRMAVFVRQVFEVIDGPAVVAPSGGPGPVVAARPSRRRAKAILQLPSPKGTVG